MIHTPEDQPQPRAWTICLIDEGPGAKIPGQLVGYETETATEEPPRRPGKYTAPRGCDLALKRFRLVKAPNGKERFDPVMHGRDAGQENTAEEINIMACMARALTAMAAGAVPADADRALIAQWQTTFDAQG